MFLFTTLDPAASGQAGATATGGSSATAATGVTAAIRRAADASGVSFDYLLGTARRESGLNPAARSGQSSATGLYQFIDSTWLQMVKEAGPGIGLSDYAAGIQKTAGGAYVAQDAGARESVLALRQDPDASAKVAAAFTQRNQQALASRLGRQPSDGELYAAHLMGAQGAVQLIDLAARAPADDATAAFPAQAAANPAIFRDVDGRARSVGEVYAAVTKASRPDAIQAMTAQMMTAQMMPQVALPTPAAGPAVWLGVPQARSDQPFAGLFRTDNAAPLSNAVAQGWSRLGPDLAVSAAGSATTALEMRARVGSVPGATKAVHAAQASDGVVTGPSSSGSQAVLGPAQAGHRGTSDNLLGSFGSFLSGLFWHRAGQGVATRSLAAPGGAAG